MRLILIAALAAIVAGCARQPAPDPAQRAAEVRRQAFDADMQRVDEAHTAALDRAQARCLELHPAPPRATPDAIARRRVLVLDCFEQRAAVAMAQRDRDADRVEAAYLRALERDADAAERAAAAANPPPGSFFNPVWVVPVR